MKRFFIFLIAFMALTSSVFANEINVEDGWKSGNMITEELDISGNLESDRVVFIMGEVPDFETDAMIVTLRPITDKPADVRYLAYKVRYYYLPYINEMGAGKTRSKVGAIGINNYASIIYDVFLDWNRDKVGSVAFINYRNKLNGSVISSVINEDPGYPINFICGSTAPNEQTRLVYDRVAERCPNTHCVYLDLESLDMNTVINEMVDVEEHIVSDHDHVYRNNKCIYCEKEPTFYKEIPMRFYTDCPEKGNIVEIEYETRDYWKEGGESFTKKALVYLPYGYDETKQYDVLILLHGHTLDRTRFMTAVLNFDYGVKSTYSNMYDWVFYEKLIGHKIIVTLDTPAEAEHKFKDMAFELKNDVLPTLANNFATYAENGELESLRKARDHFALGGSSNGAGFAHGGALWNNLDIFGSAILMSGGRNGVNQRNEINASGYKINCLVHAVGKDDRLYNDIKEVFRITEKGIEYLHENENHYLFTCNAGHDGRVAYTCVANGLQVLFPYD